MVSLIPFFCKNDIVKLAVYIYIYIYVCVCVCQNHTGVSIVCSGSDQIKHQSSESLAFMRESTDYSPHEGPITRKKFIFDDVIMIYAILLAVS